MGTREQILFGYRRRSGVTVVYTIILLTALIGLASLAVDYARVQLAKTELQRAADAAARAKRNPLLQGGRCK